LRFTPFRFIGLTTGLYAHRTGAGPLGAITLALLAGATTLTAVQIVFALVRAPLLRFRPCAAVRGTGGAGGFYATRGLAALTVPSERWQSIFALVGSIVIGATAWLGWSMPRLSARHWERIERHVESMA
jgi:hypothetical protein